MILELAGTFVTVSCRAFYYVEARVGRVFLMEVSSVLCSAMVEDRYASCYAGFEPHARGLERQRG